MFALSVFDESSFDECLFDESLFDESTYNLVNTLTYQSKRGSFRNGSESPQEVARLAGQALLADVHHVEEEGQLAADAVLAVARVVQHLGRGKMLEILKTVENVRTSTVFEFRILAHSPICAKNHPNVGFQEN
jgi:hypothetical protein